MNAPGWAWREFGGRLMLVTASGGARVILAPQRPGHIQTRDLETGALRPIREDDDVARLIIAAQDLYAALVETLAVATRNESGPWADKARAALAKAEGRAL